MNRQRRSAPVKDEDLILGDGTKCHGLGGKKNEINVILGKDQKTGEKSLLGLSVNKDWQETALQYRGRARAAVSDNEPGLRNVLLEKADYYGACNRHCLGDVKYYLWSAGLPKKEREVIVDEVESVLQTLHNSVSKHLADGDFERLKWRVGWTLGVLEKISVELAQMGLETVAKFIRNCANYMVTYARLTMANVDVPWTNNLIERLMGEIAKRIKHKWMHCP